MKIPKNQTLLQAGIWNAAHREEMRAAIRRALATEQDPVGILIMNMNDAQLREFVLRELSGEI